MGWFVGMTGDVNNDARSECKRAKIKEWLGAHKQTQRIKWDNCCIKNGLKAIPPSYTCREKLKKLKSVVI